jgi:hypothetical protein
MPLPTMSRRPGRYSSNRGQLRTATDPLPLTRARGMAGRAGAC